MKYEPMPTRRIVEIVPTKYPDIFEYNILARNPDAGKENVCYAGEHLMIAHGIDSDGEAHLLGAALDFKIVCEAVLKMIATHQVYDRNAKQLLELVLAEANGEDVRMPWWKE